MTTNSIDLPHLFEIFVPTQCVCTKPLDQGRREKVYHDVRRLFYEWFGGYTLQHVQGGWALPDNSLAEEDVDVVRSYASEDAFDDHLTDVRKLAVAVGDALSQDMVLITVDGRPSLFPRSTPNAPHCSHELPPLQSEWTEGLAELVPASAQPATETDLRWTIYSSLASFSTLQDARRLFCSTLNYKASNEHLPCVGWPASARLHLFEEEPPEVIADANGFRVIYVRLKADRLLRAHERAIIRQVYRDNPAFRGLFVVSNSDQSQWEFVNALLPGEMNAKFQLRRIRVGEGERVRTATERMALIALSEAEERLSAAEIQDKHTEAFSVGKVQQEFFNTLVAIYEESILPDIRRNTKDEGRARHAGLILLNRLIFLSFIQKKRWLADKQSHLSDKFQLHRASPKSSSYYSEFLAPLFLALATPDHDRHSLGLTPRFDGIPYLNGGLFEPDVLMTTEA